MIPRPKLAATVVMFLVASWLSNSSAFAELLFYGGDPTTTSAFYDVYNQYPSPYQSFDQLTTVYDNFVVPIGATWKVSELFANIGTPPGLSNSQAYYEIRTDMNNGTGGTLFASGTLAVTTTAAPNSVMINGEPTTQIEVSLPTPITLTGGTTYWFSLVPIATFPDTSNRFLGTGGPTNAVDTPATIQSYLEDSGSYYSNSDSWSMGLEGTQATAAPEPGTFGLGLSGVTIAGLLWIRDWKRARSPAASRRTITAAP